VDKLIIHHGDRVTEHELRAAPLTIGRDPECDLFFADKKLSRKHARVERVGAGFRLVDLESRNGSWVNEARVEARDLVPGDEIRLGGLRIQLEQDRDRDAGDEST
jgi:adenylate cyclase